MSVIPEPDSRPTPKAALSVCADCHLTQTCRIAASLNRLARLRDKLPQGGVHSWLHDRIDDYLDVPVCLADVFRIGAPHVAPPPPDRTMQSWPDMLQMAVRRREADLNDGAPA